MPEPPTHKRKRRYTPPLTADDCLPFLDAYRELGSYAAVGRKFGLSRADVWLRVQRAQEGNVSTVPDTPASLGVGLCAPFTHPQGSPLSESAPTSIETTSEPDGSTTVTSKSPTIKTLDDLLAAAQVDMKTWQVDHWIANKWDAVQAGGGTVPLWQVKAWLVHCPSWGLESVKPVRSLPRKPSKQVQGHLKSCLLIPDSQNGYRVDRQTGTLTPLHDRQAWDLAVQVAQRLQPETIVLLGDMMDLSPWSTKYIPDPSVRYTTQPTVIELHWWISQLRLASPGARIIYLEGNHEARITKALNSNLDEAAGLKPADDPTGHALMSIPRLLALDSLDVEYIAPYGAEWWLWDTVKVIHGVTVRQGGGSTAAAILKGATSSVLWGHCHRLELGARTITTPTGQEVIYALSPGSLCKSSGEVPGAVGAPDWQQGLAVLELDASGQVFPTLLPIHDGKTIHRGQLLQGQDRVDDLRVATGWGF